MKKHKESENLYLKAISSEKKSLGEEHPSYALSLNNLAALYKEMHRYDEAEPLYLKAVEYPWGVDWVQEASPCLFGPDLPHAGG